MKQQQKSPVHQSGLLGTIQPRFKFFLHHLLQCDLAKLLYLYESHKVYPVNRDNIMEIVRRI